jgi:tetratricopeptide (TPR) repeat protein/uncharacterized protein YegL
MIAVFMNKGFLLLLAVIPLLLLLCALAAIGRRRAIARLLDPDLSERLLPPSVFRKRRITELCLVTAVVLVVLGLARPAWDTETVRHPKTGRDLVFLLDISQSMLAEDQPPSRLACAKNSILQCLDEFQSGRVGLVVFAGSTAIRCPLTRDFDFFRSTLDELAPDSVPVGGTRIGDAITKTVEKVLTGDDADYRDVLLITDGDNHGPISTNAVSALVESGARLIVIGLGSDSVPSEIPIRDEESGEIAPLVYRDRIVHTMQRSEDLEKIAGEIPDSIYLNVGTNPLDLADVYRTHIAATLRPSSEESTTERPREQYWRFLLAALAFLVAGFLPWRSRPPPSSHSQVRPPLPASAEATAGIRGGRRIAGEKSQQRTSAKHRAATGNSQSTRVAHLAAVDLPGGSKSVLVSLLLTLLLAAPSVMAESRARLFSKGVSAYKEGDFGLAIENFSAAQQKAPDAIIDYNLGTCYYRQGDMPYALMCFARAAETAPPGELSAVASYNVGNSMFMMAFSEESLAREDAMELLRGSIAAYETAVEANPDYEDAVFNMGIARQALEAIRKSKDGDTENEDGTEEREVGEDENPTQESEPSDTDKNTEQGEEDESEDEQKAPNLTPEEILEEEEKNKLTRSRKKHSEFSKTRKNW